VYWGFLELWSGWRVLAQKTGAFANFGNFSGIFGEFSRCLESLGPNRNYFSKIEDVAVIFPNAQGPQ
jgi:hypothetical protein